MAVQQSKKSKSKKGMRRSHHHAAIPPVVFCQCGEPTLPHSVCAACGVYRGRQVVSQPAAE